MLEIRWENTRTHRCVEFRALAAAFIENKGTKCPVCLSVCLTPLPPSLSLSRWKTRNLNYLENEQSLSEMDEIFWGSVPSYSVRNRYFFILDMWRSVGHWSFRAYVSQLDCNSKPTGGRAKISATGDSGREHPLHGQRSPPCNVQGHVGLLVHLSENRSTAWKRLTREKRTEFVIQGHSLCNISGVPSTFGFQYHFGVIWRTCLKTGLYCRFKWTEITESTAYMSRRTFVLAVLPCSVQGQVEVNACTCLKIDP